MRKFYAALLAAAMLTAGAGITVQAADAAVTPGTSTGKYATATGAGSVASGYGATAVGGLAHANSAQSFAGGYNSQVTGSQSTGVGAQTTVNGANSFAGGSFAKVNGDQSVAIGNSAVVGTFDDKGNPVLAEATQGATAIGNHAGATGAQSTAVGNNASSSGAWSTALGMQSSASGEVSFASGYQASASGYHSSAVGSGAIAQDYGSSANGYQAYAKGEQSTADGYQAEATGAHSSAFGGLSHAKADGSTALGYQAEVQEGADKSTAIGISSHATASDAVALGSGSWATEEDTVSVGRGENDPDGAYYRRVVNMADGRITADSHDAVTGRQLWGVQQDVNHLSDRVSDLGGEIDNVGAISAALAGLHPLDYDGTGSKFQIAAAMGNYDGTQAAAIGGFYHFNEDVMMSLGGATSFGGDNKSAFNVGVTFRVGEGGGHKAVPADVQERLDAQEAEIAALKAQVEALLAKDAQ